MKIVIAGGNQQAEFIISMFKGKENELIVINPSQEVADTLVKRTRVKVYKGLPWRKYVLEETNAYGADVFIALCESDTDNYGACMMAKKVFSVKKTICLVTNPKNVDLYKKLGVDSVISSTYLLAQSIRGESSVESLIKTLSLDNDRVNVVEAVVLSSYEICGKPIKDIHFPRYASIAAIYRNYQIIIPSGLIVLEPKDTLLMVTAPENIKRLLAYVQTERDLTSAPKVFETAVQVVKQRRAVKQENHEEIKADHKAKTSAKKEIKAVRRSTKTATKSVAKTAKKK